MKTLARNGRFDGGRRREAGGGVMGGCGGRDSGAWVGGTEGGEGRGRAVGGGAKICCRRDRNKSKGPKVMAVLCAL